MIHYYIHTYVSIYMQMNVLIKSTVYMWHHLLMLWLSLLILDNHDCSLCTPQGYQLDILCLTNTIIYELNISLIYQQQRCFISSSNCIFWLPCIRTDRLVNGNEFGSLQCALGIFILSIKHVCRKQTITDNPFCSLLIPQLSLSALYPSQCVF